MRQPELRIVYMDEDSSVKVRRTMHDWDKVDAAYFVDNQMDLELDYGRVVISAQVEELQELALRIIELTYGRALDDEQLTQLREEVEQIVAPYDPDWEPI